MLSSYKYGAGSSCNDHLIIYVNFYTHIHIYTPTYRYTCAYVYLYYMLSSYKYGARSSCNDHLIFLLYYNHGYPNRDILRYMLPVTYPILTGKSAKAFLKACNAVLLKAVPGS